MTAEKLIEALKDMPPNAEVKHLWDGEPRTTIQNVWLSRDGDVVTSDFSQVCYSRGARPEKAPEETYWYSDSDSNNPDDDY